MIGASSNQTIHDGLSFYIFVARFFFLFQFTNKKGTILILTLTLFCRFIQSIIKTICFSLLKIFYCSAMERKRKEANCERHNCYVIFCSVVHLPVLVHCIESLLCILGVMFRVWKVECTAITNQTDQFEWIGVTRISLTYKTHRMNEKNMHSERKRKSALMRKKNKRE